MVATGPSGGRYSEFADLDRNDAVSAGDIRFTRRMFLDEGQNQIGEVSYVLRAIEVDDAGRMSDFDGTALLHLPEGEILTVFASDWANGASLADLDQRVWASD